MPDQDRTLFTGTMLRAFSCIAELPCDHGHPLLFFLMLWLGGGAKNFNFSVSLGEN
jgi:hypothetical protein